MANTIYPEDNGKVGLYQGKFTNGDAAAGIRPSRIPAEHLNLVAENLEAAIRGAGLTPGNAATDQLKRAIENLAGRYWFAGNSHKQGEIVCHNNTLYRCTQGHTTGSANAPGTPGGAAYWEPFDDIDSLSNYYTKVISDGRYYTKGEVYTRAQSDGRYYTQAQVDSLLQSLYPVGSIYISVSSSNPASILGFGIWSQVPPGYHLTTVGGSIGVGAKGIKAGVMQDHRHFNGVADESSTLIFPYGGTSSGMPGLSTNNPFTGVGNNYYQGYTSYASSSGASTRSFTHGPAYGVYAYRRVA